MHPYVPFGHLPLGTEGISVLLTSPTIKNDQFSQWSFKEYGYNLFNVNTREIINLSPILS